MLIEMLNAAASAGAAPQTEFGFIPAMKQGGVIAIATVVILGIMFVGSIYILITKWWDQRKVFQQWDIVRTNFWKAPNLKDGAAKLGKDTAFRQIVDDGIVAQEQHSKMTDKLEAHEWLHQSLALSEDTVNNYLGKGLAFLATTGATAPFVGLFGTVVGIYRALVKIGAAGSASIDKVAGPVGEALIMTALGLLVAVPAVLGYNWLQARNKRIGELVHRFSNDILANISSNGAVKPPVAATPARPAAAPAKPAAAPAAAAKPAAGNTSLKK